MVGRCPFRYRPWWARLWGRIYLDGEASFEDRDPRGSSELEGCLAVRVSILWAV